MPCSIASRSWSSPAISSSSSPKVDRFSRLASTYAAAEPIAVAMPTYSPKVGSSRHSSPSASDSGMPTETSPTREPLGPYSGALPLADRPVAPSSMPTCERWSRTTIGSATGLPTSAGMVCEWRMPCRSITTTYDAPDCFWMRAATLCTTSPPVPYSIACWICGSVAVVCAMASARCS